MLPEPELAGAGAEPDANGYQTGPQQQPCHGGFVGPAYQEAQPMYAMYASRNQMQMGAQHALKQQLQVMQGGQRMGEPLRMRQLHAGFTGCNTWQGERTNQYNPSLAEAHCLTNGNDHLSNHLLPGLQDEPTLEPEPSLQQTSCKEAKFDEVDGDDEADFERDVTNAVAMFLQGNDMDIDSEDCAKVEDSATCETEPSRALGRKVSKTVSPKGDEQFMDKVKAERLLVSLVGQFAKRLQQLTHDPDSNMPSKMPAAGTDSMESMSQLPENLDPR